MKKYFRTIPTVLTGLILGFVFIGCQNKESKNETIETQKTQAVADFTPEDYRFPREEGMTKGGYPVTLSGKPITKTPLVIKTDKSKVRDYPEHFIPGNEV